MPGVNTNNARAAKREQIKRRIWTHSWVFGWNVTQTNRSDEWFGKQKSPNFIALPITDEI
jgi:hypothetical protein